MTHKKVPTPMARRKRGWGIDLRFSRQNRIKSTIKSINYNSWILLSFIYPFDFIYIFLTSNGFLAIKGKRNLHPFFNDLFLNEQNQQIKATPFPALTRNRNLLEVLFLRLFHQAAKDLYKRQRLLFIGGTAHKNLNRL